MTQKIRDKKRNIFSTLNAGVILFAAAIIIVCYFRTIDLSKKSLTEKIEPCTVAILNDGSKEYFFDLRDYDYHYSGLMFYTSHQIVSAFTNGKELYTFDKTGGFFASTTGTNYNFIMINQRMPMMAVIIKSVYEQTKGHEPDFYIGNPYEMYDEIMTRSMPRFFVSFMIIMLSVILFVYYILMHKKQNLGKELIYLAYLSLFCGVWSIHETDVAVLLVRNKIADSLIPYICLMLVIPPFIEFFDSYLAINCTHFKKVLEWAAMIEFIVLTTLHFLKIAEYRETLFIMQGLLAISVVYMVAGMIGQVVKGRIDHHIEICVVGLSLFLIAVIVDTIQYYKALGDADRIGRYVFLIFVLMIAWDMIKDANEILEKGRRAKQLEIFALTDSMTGLLNRNAFESHAKTEDVLEGVIAIVADANGLKACNDTYGHEAGDEYITIVADIFNSVYGKYGNCYRTGGDEFCCIIPANGQINIERLRKLFLAKVYTANLEGEHQFNIAVAIGEACYDATIDKDFRALVKRADACMYENKRASKTS